jgi:hypothetical protein
VIIGAVAGLGVALAMGWLSLNVPARHAWLPIGLATAAALFAVACIAIAIVD